MTKRDKETLKQGKVIAGVRDGNDRIVQVALVGEENRSPRTVRVHAMSNDVSAIKAALAQRTKENERLSRAIFG